MSFTAKNEEGVSLEDNLRWCSDMIEDDKFAKLLKVSESKCPGVKIEDYPCKGVTTLESGLTAGGLDISNPSKIPELEWAMICLQLHAVPEELRPEVEKCSPKFKPLFSAAKSKCAAPLIGGGERLPNNICQQAEHMLRA
jgi:hypothetical protein